MTISEEQDLNELSHQIIGTCIDIHKQLGPGLLESIYQDLLCFDLGNKGISFEKEKEISLIFKGNEFHTKLRADLIIENKIIVELKAVKEIHPIYGAQLLTYMKLTKIALGLLINFDVTFLKDGIHRFRL